MPTAKTETSWTRSKRGNLWTLWHEGQVDQLTITIFYREGSWRICLAGRGGRKTFYDTECASESETVIAALECLECGDIGL